MDAGLLKRFVVEVLRRNPLKIGNSIVTVSEIATITTPNPHGLNPDDKVQIRGTANPLSRGFRKILDTPAPNAFTVIAKHVPDESDANNPNIIYHETGIEVVKANSYSSAPPKPYITVRVFSDDDRGFPITETISQSESQVDEQVSTFNIAQCELIFYSNENTGEFSAQNLAKFFITALGFSRSRQFQADNDFGVLEVRSRINADIALGDLVERRQVVEFSVNYIFTITEEDVPFFNADGFIVTLEVEN